MAEITRRELDRQISEYEDGELNRSNVRDLAALYIIRDYLYPETAAFATGAGGTGGAAGCSFSGPETVPEYGNTDFFRAIAGKDAESVWQVMEQLMETLSVLSEPLYKRVLRQLGEIS